MPSLKDVKSRINSVNSTMQITKAMKLVAASKLRRAQEKTMKMRPYAQKLDELLKKVSSAAGDSDSAVYAEERDVNKMLVIAVTSDKGLCGAFNTNIFRKIDERIKGAWADLHGRDAITYLPIGKKAAALCKRRRFRVINEYTDLFSDLSFENVASVAEYAMQAFRKVEFDKVVVVYNEFKNVATQIVRDSQFLPIEQPEAEDAGGDSEYIFEPSKSFIVDELIPKSLKVSLYKAVLESNAAEHGARMTAMDKATDNATDLLKDLKLQYNRTRQAAITNEILEIVSGAEALSQSD